jgi:hypothetical protein
MQSSHKNNDNSHGVDDLPLLVRGPLQLSCARPRGPLSKGPTNNFQRFPGVWGVCKSQHFFGFMSGLRKQSSPLSSCPSKY